MSRKDVNFKVYLGTTKTGYPRPEKVYLTGFSWDCGWYWGGGYIETKSVHTHFNSCFLDVVDVRGHPLGNFVSPWYKGRFPEDSIEIQNGCAVWEDLDFFLNDAQYSKNQWWRIKDLYKQFYIYQDAAETFQYGGNCTIAGRSDKEIDLTKAAMMNDHIEQVIIPEIVKALLFTRGD